MTDTESGGRPLESLASLLANTPGARLVSGDPETRVRAVRYDSRRVEPGDLFVAIPGQRADGRRFVPAAVARGAAAVVTEAPLEAEPGVPAVLVPNARQALGDLAAALAGQPSRAMQVVGVTGTDGKTTVTRLIAAIMAAAGRRVGWLTTVDVNVAGETRRNKSGHTTPESPEVQAVLREMRDAGVQLAAVEASSHALALERLRGCAFDLAVFTNLAPEHLNFHGSLEQYRADKGRLFATPGLRYAVLNADDPNSAYYAAHTAAEVYRYGLDAAADLRADEIEVRADGCAFTPRWQGQRLPRLETRYPGRFNVSNWLAAILAARLLGAPMEAVERAARTTTPPPGRMELIEAGQPFRVVVDFSHTPHALEAALRELRPHTPGRLMTTFGHAGERDPENRPAMGAAAGRLADYFVITTDDPLDEDPAEISARVREGALAAGRADGRDFVTILDRRAAFRHLLERARDGDTVLLAGRGHEQAMPVAGVDLPFDDAVVAREILGELGYRRYPESSERV